MSWLVPSRKRHQQLRQWTPSPSLYRTASPASSASVRKRSNDGNSPDCCGDINQTRYRTLSNAKSPRPNDIVETPSRAPQCVFSSRTGGLSPVGRYSSMKSSVLSSLHYHTRYTSPGISNENRHSPSVVNLALRHESNAGSRCIQTRKPVVHWVPLPSVGAEAIDLLDWKIARRRNDIGALVELLTLMMDRERKSRLDIERESDLLYNYLKQQEHRERDGVFFYTVVLPVVRLDSETPCVTAEHYTSLPKNTSPETASSDTLITHTPLVDQINCSEEDHNKWDESFATHSVMSLREDEELRLMLVDEEVASRRLVSIAEEGCRWHLRIKIAVADDRLHRNKLVLHTSEDVLWDSEAGEEDGKESVEPTGEQNFEKAALSVDFMDSWKAANDAHLLQTEAIKEQLGDLPDGECSECEMIDRVAPGDETHILDVEHLDTFLIAEKPQIIEECTLIYSEEEELHGAILGKEALGAAQLTEWGSTLWHMRHLLDAIAQRIENLLCEEETSRRHICGDAVFESINSSSGSLFRSGISKSSLPYPVQRKPRLGIEQRERSAIWNAFHNALHASREAALHAVMEEERLERAKLDMKAEPKYISMLWEMESLGERQELVLDEQSEREAIEYDEVRHRVEVDVARLCTDMSSATRREVEDSSICSGLHEGRGFVLNIQQPGSLISAPCDDVSRPVIASASPIYTGEKRTPLKNNAERGADGAGETSKGWKRAHRLQSLVLSEEVQRKLLFAGWLEGFLNMMDLDTMATEELISGITLCDAMKRHLGSTVG